MTNLHLPLLLLALAAVVLVTAVVLRRRRARRDNQRGISATLVISAAYAGLATLGAIITLVNLLVSDQLLMTVAIDPGTAPFDPSATAGPSVITGDVLGGTLDVFVDHAPTMARVLWAIGQCLSVLVPATIAALIALACFQILRGQPFARSMSRAALVTGFVVLVGGTLADVLSQWGAGIVAREALPFDGTFPTGLFSVIIPFWPIGAALAFGALSTVLSAGYSLQKDTAGLV